MRRALSSLMAVLVAAVLLLASACSSGTDAVTEVEPTKAVSLIDSGDYTVVDVRTPAEFAAGHVEGAQNIDVSSASFTRQVKALDKHGAYLLYCQSGNRSSAAAEKLADLGFTKVVDAGGIGELGQAGAQVVPGA